MEYTREWPQKSAVSKKLTSDIIGKMDGSPVRGFHPAKIGFGMEMLLSGPPTIVREIASLSRTDTPMMREGNPSNLLPLALNMRKLNAFHRTARLLKTDDGTVITALVLDAKQECGTSFAVRDMDADQLWYVYEGSGGCYTDLGAFSYKAGDFVYIPKHTLSFFRTVNTTRLIGIQSEKGLRLVSRRPYDNVDVPFNEFAMRLPEPYEPEGGPDEKVIFVKRNGAWSSVTYQFTPFLCVAWKGAPYPFAISTSELNFEYVQSIHPDPSNFAVFAAPDASTVVSVLGPRFVHSLPYNHLNEWDEFLFYAKEYDARKGSGGGVGESGTATLHPQGIWHGPQMAAFEKWQKEDSHKGGKNIPWVNDLAIMFETKHALQLLSDADCGILIKGYENSWLESWQDYQQRHPRGVGGW